METWDGWLERQIDQRVRRRLVMDGRYTHAWSSEEAAIAEERITAECELEVIGELLDRGRLLEADGVETDAGRLEELERRQEELLEELGL